MTFTLTIQLGNDAMRSGRHVAKALREVARRLELLGGSVEDGNDGGKVRDVNGNTVGGWEITDGTEDDAHG